MSSDGEPSEFGPWNPGIETQLPREYLPLSTMFRPENVSTNLKEAQELSDFCGLPAHELVAFRAERLILHELIIRVTADIFVNAGKSYEDLGINFRSTMRLILARYIQPHLAEITADHGQLRATVIALVEQELARDAFAVVPTARIPPVRRAIGNLFGLLGAAPAPEPPRESADDRERRVLAEWRAKAEAAPTPLERACFAALFRVATAITGRHGRLIGDGGVIAGLVGTLVCNGYGSGVVGEAIEPWLRDAIAKEGLRLLPAQAKPVVMNVKGASASGKSTMRPLQRALAEKIAVPWDDFSLISPDIWRKVLLEYDTLGAAYKYAGTMTGHELEIIDRKLDGYMARKAARGRMSHLLIDRFRFDSFAPETDADDAGTLLTRFGDLVYMFFMITPPDATVERAWRRGLKFGRYKAVEDLLDHNVEAYTGMPQLFFTWALSRKKRVHYEFLDNSVPEGEKPRTVAFGWNGEMNILDVACLLNVDRYRKINIYASRPEDVYLPDRQAPELNVAFLKRCAQLIPAINFADQASGEVYARLEQGKWVWRDEARFAQARADPQTRAGLEAIGGSGACPAPAAPFVPPDLEKDRLHTLGAWGRSAGRA